MKLIVISIYDGGYCFNAKMIEQDNITELSKLFYKLYDDDPESMIEEAKVLRADYLIICEDGDIQYINLNDNKLFDKSNN